MGARAIPIKARTAYALKGDVLWGTAVPVVNFFANSLQLTTAW
jgi:hypothetical protein